MHRGVEPVEALGRGLQLREQLFSGRIARVRATGQTLAWVGEVESLLCDAFRPYEPRAAERALDNEAWLSNVIAARRRLAATEWLPLARTILSDAGLDPRRLAIDTPRLRAVKSGGHRIPSAAPAYFAHRDTWYGNPAAQVNAWLALHDVAETQTFRLFADAFDRAVRNDSGTFDLSAFTSAGGFQSFGGDGSRRYPRALDAAEWGAPLSFSLKRGELLLFSAAHLHETCRHDDGSTRFSIDFRCVDFDDLDSGRAAPNADDDSIGDTVLSYAGPP